MTDLLATLNNTDPGKETASWEAEVAKAEAEIKPPEPEKPPENVSHETTPPAPVIEAPKPVVAEEEKSVPLKALHEERQARQALERKLAEFEQRFSRPPAPQAEEPQEPDPETDPIGALKHHQAKLAAFQQQQAAQAQQSALSNYYAQSARQFGAQEPAFKEAYDFAIQNRAKELEAFGTPKHLIEATIRQEEMQIVASAIQGGRNPAEVIYQLAEVRGFKKAAPVPATPATPPAPAIDPALEKAKADAATSLTTGGKPPKNELTVDEAVRTLKGAALDSFLEKEWKAMEQAGGRKSSLFRN